MRLHRTLHRAVTLTCTQHELDKAEEVGGKVVSAVCHGPVGLVGVKTASGEALVKGRKVTGFSNSEERAVAKEDVVPFLLEDKLKELGGSYESGADWAPCAVRDGRLVTGQNPGSSAACAKLVVQVLSE
ncbi:DJ-1_PfpI domain-containing protein [Haematococcus lacustris]|uniref:DJ-1_PfpI domain-containing protein n=1 Tax=Haematococcus lacustris TaxID=44745 RepID=A0A6A0AB42_HAELA|nr:DJ-1_PfpI domain-containing protein [Haematococcus lacustris]